MASGAGQAASQPASTQRATRNTQYASAVELLTSAKSPLFIYGPDAATGERGGAMVAALNNLANLLGQGDKLAYVGREANSQGCRDMGLLPDALPGQLPISDAAVRDRLGKLWGVQPPAEPGHSLGNMLAGGVKGLMVVGLDPAAEPATAQALQALDFLVVQDLFLTETAQLAEVVLPACSFAEADGTYTNLERRVQRGPEGIQLFGQSRPDWAILAALAEKWQAVEGRSDHEGSPEAGQAQGSCPYGECARLEAQETQGPAGADRQALELSKRPGGARGDRQGGAGLCGHALGDARRSGCAVARRGDGARRAQARKRRDRPAGSAGRPAASISSVKACCGMAASSCSTPPNRCAA